MVVIKPGVKLKIKDNLKIGYSYSGFTFSEPMNIGEITIEAVDTYDFTVKCEENGYWYTLKMLVLV